MAKVRFSNFASARLAARVGPTTTSFEVAAGEGAEFPALADGEVFYAVVTEEGVDVVEIVKAISRAGDRITVQRGIGGTAASPWTEAAVLELRPLAQAFEEAEAYIGAGELASVLEGEGGVEVTRLGDTVQIYSPALKSGRSRGALIATSGTLATAGVLTELRANWVLEPDAPAGTGVFENEVLLPALRPEENIDGVWVVALVDGVEVSEVKFPWGILAGGGTPFSARPQSQFQTGLLRYREAIVGSQTAIFVSAYLEAREGDQLHLALAGTGEALPANATAKVYWSVSTGVTGGGTGNENVRGRLVATTTDLPTAATESGQPVATTWLVESDAPAGITAGTNAKLYIPDLRPENDVDGFWAVSEVRGREIEEVKFTWGVAGAERERLTGERKIAPLKLVRPVLGGVTGVFVDVKMVALEDQPTYLELTGNGQTLPGGAKVRIYFSVVATAGGGPGSGRTRGTDLGIRADPDQLTLTSSTGGNVVVPAATDAVAGVMSTTDKAKANRSLDAAGPVDAGSVVVGTRDGTREVRGALGDDLTGLAAQLADSSRGAQELALKSELGAGAGGTGGSSRGALFLVSDPLPTSAAEQRPFEVSWRLTADAPAGVRLGGGTLHGLANDSWVELPALRPAENVNGVWVVALVDGVEISEVFITWGGSGSLDDRVDGEKVVAPLKFRDAVHLNRSSILPEISAVYVDVVMVTRVDYPTFIRLGTDGYDLPPNSTVKMYWSVSGGGAGTGGGGGGQGGGTTGGGATDLGVTRDATQITVTSSTGTDAIIPEATAVEAGGMSAADKVQVDRATEADAVIDSGSVVFGEGSRNVRGETPGDLTALAGKLADSSRGPSELALKSELGSGDARGVLLATSSVLPTGARASGSLIGNTWAVDPDAPMGVTSVAGSLHLPELRPSDEVDGLWVVALVSDTPVAEIKVPWGYAGITTSHTNNKYKYATLKLRDAVVGGHSASFVDVVLLTNSLVLVGDNTALPADSTVKVYLSVVTGGTSAGGGGVPVGQGTTDLGVVQDSDQLVVTSSTGTDAILPAASRTEAGVMTAADRVKAERSVDAAATLGAGAVVVGATDGTRDVRRANAADLTGLATELADGARGTEELALKSEVTAAREGNSRGDLFATSGVLPTQPPAAGAFFQVDWTIEPNAPAGVRAGGGHSFGAFVNSTWVELPPLRPAQNVNGVWVVALVAGVEISEMFVTWGGSGASGGDGERVSGNLKLRDPVEDPNDPYNPAVSGILIDVVMATRSDYPSFIRLGSDGYVLPDNSTVKMYWSITTGSVGTQGGGTATGNELQSGATIDESGVVVGALDGSRSVRQANAADLTALAGELADPARGTNELALRSEITGGGTPAQGGATDLSVTRDADNVVVVSSTGTDATLPAASVTQAGVMTASDKNRTSRALTAAAEVGAGRFITGAGGRNTREALSADLTALAARLASGDRGAAELALKSELPSDEGGGSLVHLVDDMAYQASDPADAVLIDLDADLQAGNLLVCHWDEASQATRGIVSVTVVSDEIIGLENSVTDPTTADWSDAFKVMLPRPDSDTFHQEAAYFWRHADADKFYVALSRDGDHALTFNLYSIAFGGGGAAGGVTDLSVTRSANQVVVASSTGTNATLPAASTTEAGVMSAADKTKSARSVEAAAVVPSGSVVVGSDGTRNVQAATAANLTALATELADGARGGAELALKSEIAAGGGGESSVRGQLIATSSDIPRSPTTRLSTFPTMNWVLAEGASDLGFGVNSGGDPYLTIPHLKPRDDVDGLWFVATTPDGEWMEAKSTWGLDGAPGAISSAVYTRKFCWLAFPQALPTVINPAVYVETWGARSTVSYYRIRLLSAQAILAAGSKIRVYLSVAGGGGGAAGGGDGLDTAAVDARIESWAQEANTDDIPGDKLANAGVAVVANAQANLAGFNVGSLVFNLDDQHFYRVRQDRTHAVHPLRITFSPDDLATDASSFLVQGYARAAFNPYASAAEGSLALAPNVTATVPDALDLVLSVAEPDRGSGTIMIGIDSTSPFVPARFRWRAGTTDEVETIAYDADVSAGVHRYFATSHLDKRLGNVWRIAEGQTEDLEIDFDIEDAAGISIAPGTALRKYLERIDLPGTVTAFAGNVSVPYGRHMAPQPQSGILIDELTGDEYYARRSTDPDLVIVEPVSAGADTYGLAPGNGASFNAPSGLSRLAWDPVTGLVDVEGTATDLGRWKKVSHVADPAVGGDETREARLVEVPVTNAALGARRKRALLCDWHSNLVRLTAVANSDGDPQLTVSGGHVWYDVSARRLRMQLRYPQANVDDGQLIGLQRITPEVSSNIHWRCGIQESASDDGTVPATGLWGDLGGGLHPVWFEWSLRVVGTEAEQRSGSYIEAGHRVLADETMWMVLYYHSEETEDFISVAPTLVNAIKLSHDPTDVTTGSVQRHRYVIADDSPNLPAAIYSIPTSTQPWYVGIVITANDATNVEGFVRSLEPINFDRVEIEGVPIPMTMSERRMVLQSGSVTSPLVSSILRTDWQSDVYATGQEAPLTANREYAVDYSNQRGVRGRTYRSHTQPASKHAASAFQLLDSADNAETTSEGARAWWEVRSRGLPRTVAPPRDQGAPWRLRRWGGEEHRAVPDRTEHDVQGYVVRDEAVSGQFQIVNWSRTALQQLTDGAGSVVIEEVMVSRVTSGNRDLTIRAATGGPLTAAEIRVVNRSQGWTATFASTTPLNQSVWRVQLATAQYPFEEGDEIRLRLNATGHSPIGWNHAVTSWQDV